MLVGNNFLQFINSHLTSQIQSWCDTWLDLGVVTLELSLTKEDLDFELKSLDNIIDKRFDDVPNKFKQQWTTNALDSIEQLGYQIKAKAEVENYDTFYIVISSVHGEIILHVSPSNTLVDKYILQLKSIDSPNNVLLKKLIPSKNTLLTVSTIPNLLSYQTIHSLSEGDIVKSGHKINIPLVFQCLNQSLTGFLGQQSGKKSLILESKMTEQLLQESNIEYQELEQDVQSTTDLIGVEQLKESIQVPVSIELGQGEISLKSISDLKAGEIIKLNQSIDDLVILKANGVELGKGLLTIDEGEFAIRVTEIVKMSI
ncbi:MAG: FliM/FliN family flagellar motor switch protein [Saccharospirillaceae bacterium]|nr:FliM/FliN family flagellar motor switch protein [Pseudomonadales bacterium]NRB79741.1 FliM/FliN family flagellar motor switch protein [Saccharospirillaceae bacterium]